MIDYHIKAGEPLPLGAHRNGGGVNFALFSRHATTVELLLYPTVGAPRHQFRLQLQRGRHRTGDIWHVWIGGVDIPLAYGWRVDGPYVPERGLRYNRYKLLLDPYATALVSTERWDFAKARGFDPNSALADLSFSDDDNEGYTAHCLLRDSNFDWQDDQPLRHAWKDTVIYETHVRGLTAHLSAGVSQPGTFLGLIEKIPYLKQLGITTLELMPVQEFNANELELRDPKSGELLRNYWGYSTVAFFAPKETYSSHAAPGCQIDEFKTMVRELHRASIEVILDVVFNHTAEGDERGPTLNFRGIDNPVYYLLDKTPRHYKDFSGCGNTLNCNHPVVNDYILDCLRYWTIEMHVDGFRFDLAAVLERDTEGEPIANAPLLERIAEDPILRDVKLIAEAWDAAGIYQVGHFPGRRWSEWNATFRDDIRRFWRGDASMTGALASRLCGSADLYQRSGKQPLNSINFVTCHDGFTLHDLVSYNSKHNENNGDNNRDGTNENYSFNHGVEGPTRDPSIQALRLRQMKNLIATLMLSRGVPMLLGGDEFGRSQNGNNNAYCQDNETSWYRWELLEKNRELFDFTRQMIALRHRYTILRQERFFTAKEISWHDANGDPPDWNSAAQYLACCIFMTDDPHDCALYLLFNASDNALSFRLPSPEGGPWQLLVDTAQPITGHQETSVARIALTNQERYYTTAHSLVVLTCPRISA